MAQVRRQALYAMILMVEGTLLLMATYFFWSESSFPGDSAETGIVTGEWLWVVVAFFPLIGLYSFYITSRRQWISLGLFALYLVLMAVILPKLGASYAIDRADWFGLVYLLIPVYMVRFLVFERWQALTSVYVLLFAVLVVLGAVAVWITPDVTGYPSRGWGMLLRPLLGVMWLFYLSDVVLYHGRMDSALHLLVVFGLLLGYCALSWTQWDMSKSEVFVGLIERFRHLPLLAPFERFNPNEIAGAMVWVFPVMVGAVFYAWRDGKWLWRGLAGIAAALLLVALIVGQSRSAILGLGVTGAFVLIFFAPRGAWRRIVIVGVVVLAAFQLALLFNVLEGEDGGGLSLRDQITTTERFVFWESALAILKDYPLTGVGMNMYRDYRVRQDYPIDPAQATMINPPHAHNEFVQIATDFGIPGLLLWVAFYGLAVFELWVCVKRGGTSARIVAVATAAGLLTHGVFGLTDAIPIWDRFAFVFWVTLGVLNGQTLLVQRGKREVV